MGKNSNTPKNKFYDAILIAGMHRSGTSTVARLLAALGIYMGNNLMLPAPENPKGFWEDSTLVDINRKFLSCIAMDGDHGTIASNFATVRLHADMFNSSATLDYLEKENFLTQCFAFKDPRLCLTFPIWKKLLTAQNKKVACIIPVRNPLDVSHSLQKRNNFSVNYGISLWFVYMTSIISTIQNTPVCFINYNDIINNTDYVIQKIGAFINVDVSGNNKSLDEYKTSFIEKKLCHHTNSQEDCLKACANYPMIADFYADLYELTQQDHVQVKTIEHLQKKYSQYTFYTNLPDTSPIDVRYKIYLDTGAGFSEEDSMAITLPAQQNLIQFQIPPCGPIMRLRLDVGNTACIVQLKATTATYLNGSSGSLCISENNALSKHDNVYCFANGNPQIIFKCHKIISSVTFDICFLKINEIENILKEVNVYVNTLRDNDENKTKVIASADATIQDLENKVCTINGTLQEKDENIRELQELLHVKAAEKQELHETLSSKEALLAQSQEEICAVHSILQSKDENIAELQILLDVLTAEKQKFINERAEFLETQDVQRAALVQAYAQVSFANAELLATKARAQDIQVGKDLTQKTLEEVQLQFENLRADVYGLHIELEAAHARIAAFQSSFSWIITSPLRLIFDILTWPFYLLLRISPQKMLYKIRYSKFGQSIYDNLIPACIKAVINKAWKI